MHRNKSASSHQCDGSRADIPAVEFQNAEDAEDDV